MTRQRRIVYTGLLILFTILMSYIPGLGIVDLTSIIPGAGLLKQAPFDVAHGVVTVLLITTALVAQLRAPEAKIAALQQIAVCVIGLLAVEAAGRDLEVFALPEILAIGFLGVLVPLHPARATFLDRGLVSYPILGVACAGAVPLLIYAVKMSAHTLAHLPPYPGATEDGPSDWLNFSGAAVGIALVALLSALRTKGWRIPAWSAGLGSMVLGLEWIIHPSSPGSEPAAMAFLAIMWGVVLVATAEWQALRDRTIKAAIK